MSKLAVGTMVTQAPQVIVTTDSAIGGGPRFSTVSLVWDGVDRPTTTAWSCPNKLVARLVAALRDPSFRAIPSPVVAVDVNGATYVSHGAAFRGRAMSADLAKLGF